MKYDWTKEHIEPIIKKSVSFQETLRNLKIPTRGNNVATLQRKIKEYGIDISHFTFSKHQISLRRDIKEYLNNDISITSAKLKDRLLREGFKEYRCECCQNTEWNGVKIPLELHHINGNNQDNSLSNLQLLCPNCHALTDTYCKGKKEKEKHFCSVCHRELKTKNATLCPRCASRQRGKITISIEELQEMISEGKSNVTIGKELGVSETAVRKFRKRNQI